MCNQLVLKHAHLYYFRNELQGKTSPKCNCKVCLSPQDPVPTVLDTAIHVSQQLGPGITAAAPGVIRPPQQGYRSGLYLLTFHTSLSVAVKCRLGLCGFLRGFTFPESEKHGFVFLSIRFIHFRQCAHSNIYY